MIKEAMQFILGLAPVEQHNINDRTYTDKQLVAVMDPVPNDVDVTTLDGFKDLIQNGVENFDKKAVLIHVVSYDNVTLVDRVSDIWGRRKCYITAKMVETKGFNFGNFIDQENFIIGVQSNFKETPDRDYLLKISSSITNDQIRTSQDDGISQGVTVKAGITLKTEETLRNRLSLAPFRTFREVPQPESEFVFRVRQGTNGPMLALFEADGGAWKIAAIENVARYLRVAIAEIAEIPIVA